MRFYTETYQALHEASPESARLLALFDRDPDDPALQTEVWRLLSRGALDPVEFFSRRTTPAYYDAYSTMLREQQGFSGFFGPPGNRAAIVIEHGLYDMLPALQPDGNVEYAFRAAARDGATPPPVPAILSRWQRQGLGYLGPVPLIALMGEARPELIVPVARTAMDNELPQQHHWPRLGEELLINAPIAAALASALGGGDAGERNQWWNLLQGWTFDLGNNYAASQAIDALSRTLARVVPGPSSQEVDIDEADPRGYARITLRSYAVSSKAWGGQFVVIIGVAKDGVRPTAALEAKGPLAKAAQAFNRAAPIGSDLSHRSFIRFLDTVERAVLDWIRRNLPGDAR